MCVKRDSTSIEMLEFTPFSANDIMDLKSAGSNKREHSNSSLSLYDDNDDKASNTSGKKDAEQPPSKKASQSSHVSETSNGMNFGA